MDKLIKHHETCIEILEGIKYFQLRIRLKNDSINGVAGYFPDLVKKYINDIDTLHRCIDRLQSRYDKYVQNHLIEKS